VGLAGETCALADVAKVGTAINAINARAAISFFMALLQLTDDRPSWSCKQREADGQRFAVTSSRARARIDTGEMGPFTEKQRAKSLTMLSGGLSGQFHEVCVFPHRHSCGAPISETQGDSAPEELMMSTLKIASRYRGSPKLIVPSAAGFPVVLGSTRGGHCRPSTTLGMAMTVAVLWMATVLIAPALPLGATITSARGALRSFTSVTSWLAKYSQHDWGNTGIYQYRACMAVHALNQS
jgi:hypothetical protein